MTLLYLYVVIGIALGFYTLYCLVNDYGWEFLYEDFLKETKGKEVFKLSLNNFKNMLYFLAPILGIAFWLPIVALVIKKKYF